MPSTIYTVTRAARMSQGSELSDFWKAAAVPWKLGRMLTGMPISCSARAIALVAFPRDSPGARLKEIVTTGNCPWWLIASEVLDVEKWLNAARGTWVPVTDFT